jgi:tetratricopeptide (TPR) repeat protein
MLYNPPGVHQKDTVSTKYLIASCAVAAAVLGVAVVGGRLVPNPATSIVAGKHDGDTGRALVEAGAVQPPPVAAIEPHDHQETASQGKSSKETASKDTVSQGMASQGMASQGEIDQAMTGFDQAIERNPRDATAFRNRAKAWEARGEPHRALADYDAAIRVAPNDPAAFRDRGEFWRARSRHP